MKVLLLAAGRSKRMKPIEDKNFLSFLGKPLIQHQIEMIVKAGFEELILVGGKHNLVMLSELENALREFLKIKISLVEQKNLDLGMCGAVLAARELIGSEPILVLSSNDVFEIEALELMKKAAKNEDAESYILAKKILGYFPGGYLKVDENGFIKQIIEKPEPGKEPSNLINLVAHLHKNPKNLIGFLEKVVSKKDDLYEVALGKMMDSGCKLKAMEYNGLWQPIKYPWDVHKVFNLLFSKAKKYISSSADVSKHAVINGDVIIGERVRIFDGAVVNGPCYIGNDSVVATNSLVRDSNVGENCIIGFGTEVARSVLGHDVWTHSNYIGDSVIGDNVSFGSGTVTGNLRLDEGEVEVIVDGKKINAHTNKFGAIIGNHVRVGVNTSLMPGIKIGGGSFVGAGIVVAEDVAENSFVRGSWELKISKNNVDVSGIRREEFKKKIE